MNKMAAGGSWESPSEHNVIGNAIETLAAKIGKSEVMPVARAHGIRRSRQERAKQLSMWLRGQMQVLAVHELAIQALQDSCVYGTGALYPHRDLLGRPAVEVVWVGDLGVEEFEEEQRAVRTLYRVMTMDRQVIKKHWKPKGGLHDAEHMFDGERSRQILGEPVTVVEAWRLTTGKIKGRHVLCTSSATLVDEAWDSEEFPIKFHHWSYRSGQFFGVGLVQKMAGEQEMLNTLTDKVEAHIEQAKTYILVDTVSGVDTDAMTDEPYQFVKFTSTAGGMPPQVVTPQSVAADLRQHQETLINRCYAMHGIDRLSAQSQKPPGLNSGVALETYSDIESERFYWQTKNYEKLVVKTAEGLVKVAEEIASDPSETDKSKADVLCRTKAQVRMIRWNGIKRPTDKTAIEIEAKSQFSTTLSGRIQQVDTLRQVGLLRDEQAMLEMLDDPNLSKYRSLQAAARHVVEVQVERCLAGRRQTPDPTMPLQYALEYATQQLHAAILELGDEGDLDDDLDDELEQGIAVLREYIATVHTQIDEQEQQIAEQQIATPAPAAAGPLPQAQPPPPQMAAGPLG